MEFPWWNHQNMTFLALWGEPSVTGGFPSQRAKNADLFFCISLDKQLSKRSDCQWFETIGCSLWRYCDVLLNKRQRCNFCSKVTTSPCDITLISTLRTLLGAIESVVVVIAFRYFFHKHGSSILISVLRYVWMQNDITIIWMGNGKTTYYIYSCWERVCVTYFSDNLNLINLIKLHSRR